ncbi:RAP protein, putative [Plasmodium ovale wallikeri]|uniref:RAP protein, putative n=1 Tax=Plasmodium ovale wallikeri TaxID=864142 RepID=A0A1A8ZG72_PLAOA|nr:RAP protein, putative [Plasmodium ovale wallikeri]SBT43293.1 RAP protein, putative [Plasmodium ovale wallikeri]
MGRGCQKANVPFSQWLKRHMKYVPCGTTYFKNSLLKKNGWTIIHIPSYKWNKLKREEKDAYLIHKLSSCSEHLKNYFEKYNKLV